MSRICTLDGLCADSKTPLIRRRAKAFRNGTRAAPQRSRYFWHNKSVLWLCILWFSYMFCLWPSIKVASESHLALSDLRARPCDQRVIINEHVIDSLEFAKFMPKREGSRLLEMLQLKALQRATFGVQCACWKADIHKPSSLDILLILCTNLACSECSWHSNPTDSLNDYSLKN